ncbi:MAG TPA: heterodisulfide reductase-related iron-sulfur binding cluster [Gemmataceae bacterium]|nr:heterodisulfide reductase-related iron-sulfur binding cluster [Gemmataceae bacterium]
MTTAADPPRTPLTVLPSTPRVATGIDYELFLDCVHCGLCTSACPTYVELGTEMDSPRGRIYLMRAVTDGRLELSDPDVRRHLDLCLDCRACESACPSGVQYGRLIEPMRLHMTRTLPPADNLPWLQRLALFHVFPYARRDRLALAPVRLLQRLGLDRLLERSGLLRLLPRSVRQLYAMLPRLRPHYGRLPEVLPAEGPQRARVALFTGCVADAIFPETTLATARVLQRNGCEVWVPRAQTCCGALHYHAGHEEPAQRFAVANCNAFDPLTPTPLPPGGERGEESFPSPPLRGREIGGEGGTALGERGWGEGVDAIIVNAAGCGAMLKDYGHLLQNTPDAARGAKFAGLVRDISEFLVQLGPIPPAHPLPIRATYHDACHLCHAQQIRKPPRQLLEMIPGLELLPLGESEICCGAAGSYNLTQPEMAERLGRRKAQNILDTGAQAVFTGNVGCLLQIARHLRPRHPDLWVAHPIDALWASYSGRLPNDSPIKFSRAHMVPTEETR